MWALVFAEDSVLVRRKSVPLRHQASSPRNPYKSQHFAVSKVSCRSSSGNLKCPLQVSIQASYFGDSALARCHDFQPQVPVQRIERLRMREGDIVCSTPHPVCHPNWSTWEMGHRADQGQVLKRVPLSNCRVDHDRPSMRTHTHPCVLIRIC